MCVLLVCVTHTVSSHPLCPIAMDFTIDPLSSPVRADIQVIKMIRRLDLPDEIIAKIIARIRWNMLKKCFRMLYLVDYWYWFTMVPWEIHFGVPNSIPHA